jgi:DNA-directed RNA polymerase beta subunit
MGEGDKLVYSTALKGVVSQVIASSEAPLSEHRKDEPVEAILTPTGIISRMTLDIYSMLYSNKVLVELGKQIKEIMDGEE